MGDTLALLLTLCNEMGVYHGSSAVLFSDDAWSVGRIKASVA